jgi:hypothetical protein
MSRDRLAKTEKKKIVLCHVTMSTPVTFVMLGKTRREQPNHEQANHALLYGASIGT